MSKITIATDEHNYMSYLYNLIINLTDMARHEYIPRKIIMLKEHNYKLTDDGLINLRKATKLLANGGTFTIYFGKSQSLDLVVRYDGYDHRYNLKYEKYR